MKQRRSDHFPKLTIHEPEKKNTLEGKETVEEYLARGGIIKTYDSEEMAIQETGERLTRQQVLDRYREKGHKKSIANGTFKPLGK